MVSEFGSPPPYISGTVRGQTTTDEAPIAPFTTASVINPLADDIDTLYIQITGSGEGVLSGSGLNATSNRAYTLTGTASQITSQLRGLIFTPTNNYPGQSLTDTFELSLTDSNYTYIPTDYNTSVTDISDKPSLSVDPTIGYLGDGVFDIHGNTYGDYDIESLQLYSTSIVPSDLSVTKSVFDYSKSGWKL